MALQQPILNPSVPFCSPIFGGLCEGKMILIQGCIPFSAKRFSVNLVCVNGDIAFHFNPRFDEGNVIVCNTQEKGSWGPEERTSPMLFQRGVSFEVIINIRSCGYQVSVNGSQFINYQHRLPMHQVQTLQIKGDVSLSCISFTGGLVPPPYAPPPYNPIPPMNNFSGMTVCNPNFSGMTVCNPRGTSRCPLPPDTGSRLHSLFFDSCSIQVPNGRQNFSGMTVCNPATPFNTALSGRFFPFSKITVMGSIPYSADRFHVNLKNILTGNIALHINPRFKQGVLVRNSFISGTWGSEERNIAYLPFCPGQAFQLEITYLQNCYQVLLNGQLNFEYYHRIPPSQVDQLEIAGDVTLSCVQY
ncbi:galectin-9-like [Ahaetulla prasina]|uniref:galectin-9-like n=1 Tax=Ahaetulla prasina TaxID=499056 RepID=UPI0026473681|nr:galectin-9-like [Ahaetulla prasina]